RMKAYACLVDVERGNRLSQRQVAGRPCMRAAEVAPEKPFRRPLADPAQRDEARAHLLVGERREPVQVDPVAGEADDVRRLRPGETERDELLLTHGCKRLSRGERPGLSHARAEPL